MYSSSLSVLYHASSKTGVKADLARREAELEAKKKAFGRQLFPLLYLNSSADLYALHADIKDEQ
jgi:hypothetical protein